MTTEEARQDGALRDLVETHRPNNVTEGVWPLTRTRVKCDGGGCDFYAEHESWYSAMDAHSEHLTELLSAHVAEHVAQAKAEALGELADTIDSNDFQQPESSDDTWLDGCCDVLDLIESMQSRFRPTAPSEGGES